MAYVAQGKKPDLEIVKIGYTSYSDNFHSNNLSMFLLNTPTFFAIIFVNLLYSIFFNRCL